MSATPRRPSTPASGQPADPSVPSSASPSPALNTTPSIRRRLAAMLYEGVILFGVVFLAGYLFSTLTQQRNGLTHHNLLAAWIGLVVGVYFVWFWTHSGQTLPMKTWHVRVIAKNGTPVSTPRAIVRYVLAWLWFLPPLTLHPLLNLAVPVTLLIALAWFVVYTLVARFQRDRQFLHDWLAGTRIVSSR